MSKIAAAITVFLLIGASFAHAQRDDGVLMDVQEVNIAKMKAGNMSGAEAVMKVMEQYTDGQYRFAFISNNYLVPAQQQKYLNLGRDRFVVAVAGYPAQNNLLYTQVFFDNSFFFIALAKRETDLKRTNDMRIIRVNYEKGNAVRRNNVRDTIQRNNIIPLGIDTGER
jgi:hypothetical protein